MLKPFKKSKFPLCVRKFMKKNKSDKTLPQKKLRLPNVENDTKKCTQEESLIEYNNIEMASDAEKDSGVVVHSYTPGKLSVYLYF
jgi:hypothetical protein